MSELLNRLVKAYRAASIEFPALKEITLAQWMLESARGTSPLAADHFNFGGLKWRKEMKDFAKSVKYAAHDGEDQYCKFESPEKFISGYWHFLDRSPYQGWREHAGSAESFIKFIGPIYAGDPDYISKVLPLVEEARELLESFEEVLPHGRTDAEPDSDNTDTVENEHTEDHVDSTELVEKPVIKAFYLSPNQSSREGSKITTVVVHYTTAGNFESTKSWFQKPEAKVSAHYVVDKNGDIYQMVSDSDNSWHAGNRAVNKQSIGIEHVAKKGERLTEAQEASSVRLIKWLMSEYKIPKENIKAHKEIKSTSCPGNIFGDKLDDKTLPEFKKWVARHFSFSPKPDSAGKLGPSGLGIYVVRPGDTLSEIAKRHDTTLEELLKQNPEIKNPDIIHPGQKIIVARVGGDEKLVPGKSPALKLPLVIAEHQLNARNYQHFVQPLLGDITITGGFMEPHGHSSKPALKAIFLDGRLKDLPPSKRNIGIDYVVADLRVKAWYGGVVTRQGREGGYGRRVHLQLDVTYKHQGKEYQVYQAFAHLQKILVSEGQEIKQGQQIGVMGGSGARTDHDYPLHVDLSTYVFINGQIVQLNPQALDNQL